LLIGITLTGLFINTEHIMTSVLSVKTLTWVDSLTSRFVFPIQFEAFSTRGAYLGWELHVIEIVSVECPLVLSETLVTAVGVETNCGH
jgi:hypothetical protein